MSEAQETSPIGRPSDYSPELASRICEQLAGGISLRTVCKADDMPCAATVFNWLRSKPEFVEQYTRAKEESADALVEEMLDISDEASNDWMEIHDDDNVGYRLNGEAINRSRLRVDTRKWIASKLKPKKYGDKSTTELTGPNGKALIPEMNETEIARRIAFALQQGANAQEPK